MIRPGWRRPEGARVGLAALAGLFAAGCGPFGTPEESRNRLEEALDSIPAIAPSDTSLAYLDTGTMSFSTGQPNLFEYEGVQDLGSNSMGFNFNDVSLTIKTEPMGDSLEITGRGALWTLDSIPLPPSQYRKDTASHPIMGTGESPRMVYPSAPAAPWGIFRAENGRRMLYITIRYPRSEWGDTFDRYLYMEPYGLVYFRVNHNVSMQSDFIQFWLKAWNGQTLDREKIIGMAKGFLEAYPAPSDGRPPGLTR